MSDDDFYKDSYSERIHDISLNDRSMALDIFTIEEPIKKIDFEPSDQINNELKDSLYSELLARFSTFEIYTRIDELNEEFPFWFANFFIVESDLINHFINFGKENFNDEYIRRLCCLIMISPADFVEETFKAGLMDIIIQGITSENQVLIHATLKLVRRLIINSHFARVCLEGLKFFHFCENNLELMCDENIRYLSKTFLRYSRLDPVVGQNSYSDIGNKLQPRKNIIETIVSLFPCIIEVSDHKEVNKRKMELSNFLKTGSTSQNNKPLWHMLDFLLQSKDIPTCYGAIGSFHELALLVKNGANDCVLKTHILDIIGNILSTDTQGEEFVEIPELIFVSIQMLNTLVTECHDDILETIWKKLPRIVIDVMNRTLIDDIRIKTVATRFLCNAILFKPEFASFIGNEYIAESVSFLHESDLKLRIENLFLIINLILVSPKEQKQEFLNDEIFDVLTDFVDGENLALQEAILNILCFFIDDIGDESIDFIGKHTELMEKIEEINDDDTTKEDIHLLSQFIIEQINAFSPE